MGDFKVARIERLDAYAIRKVLASPNISNTEKIQFIKKNSTEIKNALNMTITPEELQRVMSNRPLIKFKPIKNSFTKRGDKILLAKTLGIQVNQIGDYINNMTNEIKTVTDLNFLPKDKVSAVKTYIYRHGSKDQILTFLDYELQKSDDILQTLYKDFEYNNGGIADYFYRPIHRLDNNTLINIYNVVDKNLNTATQNGKISEEDSLKTSEWVLKRIYEIQNDAKFVNAIKTKQVLSSGN